VILIVIRRVMTTATDINIAIVIMMRL